MIVVSGHLLISWTHTSKTTCYFGDAIRCVRSADQNMAAYNRPLIRHKSTSNYMKIVRRRRVDSEEVHRIIPSENMIGCIQSCTQRSRTSQTAISMLLKTGYQGADDRSQTPFVLIGNHLQITVLPETYLNNKQIFLKKSQKCTILYHEI